MGSIPGWGTKILHALEQLSTLPPQLESPCPAMKDPARHNATKTQHSQKEKKKIRILVMVYSLLEKALKHGKKFGEIHTK